MNTNLYKLVVVCLAMSLSGCSPAFASPELWKVTAYCSCVKCCGKSDGITASGKKVSVGTVACNWLPFGTRLKIGDLKGVYRVQDRGVKSLFGSFRKPIKHIDIWMSSHNEALRFGVKRLNVTII